MSGCWYAVGELTAAPDAEEEIWLAPTSADLVASLVRRLAHGMIPDEVNRRTARLAYAIGVADELQMRAVEAALRAETWSYTGASDAEIDLLLTSEAPSSPSAPFGPPPSSSSSCARSTCRRGRYPAGGTSR